MFHPPENTKTMATPLRWNMVLPNGQKLRFDMPGVRFGGTVEEVMAAINAQNNTMSENNKISSALAAQDVTDILAAFATIRQKAPFLLNLTDEERAHLPHIGDKSGGALEATKAFVVQFPEALPVGFSIPEFNKDTALFGPMETVGMASANNNQLIQDTRLALRSDLLLQILDVYACAKANNRGGRYQTYVDTMNAHFAKPRKPKTTTPPPTP